MATCPRCKVHGYESDGTFTLDTVLDAKPLGTWSLSGSQMKAVAVEKARFTCNKCGWFALGRVDVEGGYFIADRPYVPPPDAEESTDDASP